MKSIIILIVSSFIATLTFSQNVSINETGASANVTAILDVSSQTKGFLLPRMNSLERLNILSPQTGLLVYDLDLQSLFYFDGGQWVEFASSRKGLRDSNFDTKVVVEQSADDDTVRIFTKGLQKLKIHKEGLIYASEFGNISLSNKQKEFGFNNLILGHNAGKKLSFGFDNVIIGNSAGEEFVPSSVRNTIIGYKAADSITAGTDNVLLGYRALKASVGSGNVSIGTNSGDLGDNNGTENVFIGKDAGRSISESMNNNVVIGNSAGHIFSGGDDNILIGDKAGQGVTVCDRSILLGSNPGYSLEAPQLPHVYWNKLSIDNGDLGTEALIFGDFQDDWLRFNGKVGVNTSNPDSELHIIHENDSDTGGLKIENENEVNSNYWRLYTRSANGSLRFYSKDGEGANCGHLDGAEDYVAWVSSCSGAWNSTSDLRKKKNFVDVSSVIPSIMNLKVLTYHFLPENDSDKKHIGLIAQEVQKYFPELVNYDEEVDLFTMNYDGFGPIAIKGVQELKVENDLLKSELATQKAQLLLMKAEMDELKEVVYKGK